MNRYGEYQFGRFERQHGRIRGRRRQLARLAMRFAIEHRGKYPTVQSLETATVSYLKSGQRAADSEYGSFVVSFVIGPIIAFLVGKIVQWVWDHCRGTTDQQMADFDAPS